MSEKSFQSLQDIFQVHQVEIAYLFGSQAKKTAGPLSDVDIAFIFNEEISPEEYFDKELQLAHALRARLQVGRVDLVNLAQTQDPLLRYRAVLDGQLIYAIDEKERFALEDRAMKEYEDTKYLRQVQAHYLYQSAHQNQFGRSALLKTQGKKPHVTH